MSSEQFRCLKVLRDGIREDYERYYCSLLIAHC